MNADLVVAKDAGGLPHCGPVVSPIVGALHALAPETREELRRGGVYGNTDHIGPGLLDLHQPPQVVDEGRRNKRGDGAVDLVAEATDDGVHVVKGAAVGDHAEADAAQLPAVVI